MHPRRWPSYFSSCQYTPLNLLPVMCSSPCDPRPSSSSSSSVSTRQDLSLSLSLSWRVAVWSEQKLQFSVPSCVASPPRFAACFAKYKAWSSDPFCFDVQGQNKHTHICLFFRFQVSWLLCFCCLCVGLQPCSDCKCVGISMIGWVLGGSWMCWLLVCWSVCPSVCVCVLLPASVELMHYWFQSFRVACMYVWRFRACWCPIWITNQMVKFVSLI